MVGLLQKELRLGADPRQALFAGWKIIRAYSTDEIDSTEVFSLCVTSVLEQAGTMHGTSYDYSNACPHCRAGRRRRGPLRLNLSRVPKNCDLIRTVAADEVLVSRRLAESLQSADVTGYRLEPVEDVRNPPGRVSAWLSLEVTSRPVHISPPTKFGIEPFDEDSEGSFVCPLGHTLGLNLLSEVFIAGDDWDGSDFVRTVENVGWVHGLLVPSPIVLISARLKSLLQEGRFRRYETEVAYLQ